MGSRVVQEVTALLACGFKQAPHMGEAPGIGPSAEAVRGDLDPRLDPCTRSVLLGCWRGHTWTRGSAMKRRGRSPSVPTGPDCSPTTDEGCMFAEGMPDRFPRRRRTAVDAVPAKLSAQFRDFLTQHRIFRKQRCRLPAQRAHLNPGSAWRSTKDKVVMSGPHRTARRMVAEVTALRTCSAGHNHASTATGIRPMGDRGGRQLNCSIQSCQD